MSNLININNKLVNRNFIEYVTVEDNANNTYTATIWIDLKTDVFVKYTNKATSLDNFVDYVQRGLNDDSVTHMIDHHE
jgi:hypothetical protein